MTFAGYFQNGSYEATAPTLGGAPVGEPQRTPRYELTDIIRYVPEGTTKAMFEEKWGLQSNSPIRLEFCAESDCPKEVKTQMLAPRSQVRHRVWSDL